MKDIIEGTAYSLGVRLTDEQIEKNRCSGTFFGRV